MTEPVQYSRVPVEHRYTDEARVDDRMESPESNLADLMRRWPGRRDLVLHAHACFAGFMHRRRIQTRSRP